MSGKFKINNTKFPKYIERITDQKISGWSSIRRGPGDTFKAISAPRRIAVVPEPGMPSVSSGTKDPVQAALFALSGAARPFTDPFPNCSLSSGEAKFRSTAYPRNDAIVAPAPGITPIKNPCKDWRAITGVICFASSLVIRRLVISDCFSSGLPERSGSRIKNNVSGIANIAIANVIKPIPD